MPKSPLVIVVVLLCTIAGCSRQQQQASPSAKSEAATQPGQPRNSVDVVKATTKDVTIKSGDDGEVIVQLDIQKGYHVNANPPTFPYLKATELQVPQRSDVSVSLIVYPSPLTKNFPFADKPLAVYEGVTDIKAQLKVNKTTKPGQLALPAKVQIQACDDQVCYAPGTLDVTIPLIVK